MKTNFTNTQLEQKAIKTANTQLRSCVHCGLCTSTCPSYLITCNELDSPRGRIYLIKKMLESNAAADAKTVEHLEKCLGCYNCITTCPSSVDYRHLLDIARVHIEKTFARPWKDSLFRKALGVSLSNAWLAYFSMMLGKIAKSFHFIMPKFTRPLIEQVPNNIHLPEVSAKTYSPKGAVLKRVVLLSGCVQQVISPKINQAAIELLNNLGVEVITLPKLGCCGSLELHINQVKQAEKKARNLVEVVYQENKRHKIDAFIVTTSGCGSTIKDYQHLLNDENEISSKVAELTDKTHDISEFLEEMLPKIVSLAEKSDKFSKHSDQITRKNQANFDLQKVAYHCACSLQHGQGIKNLPQNLLRSVGFEVVEPRESNLCCGSAGVYSILQPEISSQLQLRKQNNIDALNADVFASGNMPCINHIGSTAKTPGYHTIELLNYACGGELKK